MKDQFKKKFGPWAIVTGASDGIGRAIACELATYGMNLVLVARRENELEALSKQIKENHDVKTKTVSIDLSKADASAQLFQETDDLDVGLLCAIAGFGTTGNFLDNSIASELNMFDVNCKAVIEQTYHFGQRFKKQGSGGIILMGSLLGFQGVPGSANYAATKAYIQTFAEGLHYELKPFGVDVLSVAPGPIASGFAQRAKMKMAQSQTPDVVAREAIKSLGKKLTVRPGWLAKLLEASLSLAPRSIRVRIMQKIMSGMTKH